MLYRISFKLSGNDPRIALREDDRLDETTFREISNRLKRLDSSSKFGAWTQQVLQTIAEHPEVPARKLAAQLGYEKDWLKINIRKLINLGLTISYSLGYRISPRGIAVLEYLSKKGSNDPRINGL